MIDREALAGVLHDEVAGDGGDGGPPLEVDLDIADALIARQPEWLPVPGRERIVDEIHNHVRVCPDCMGEGLLGWADVEGSKRVSCEKCGGHEDARGSGLVGAYDAADAALIEAAP